jgi:transcriptional regulator with XRE-family HTH domain
MSPPDPTVGVVVRRSRVQRGVSQENLAFQCGLTIGSISRIERGVTSPSWANVQTVARALGLTLSEFAAAVEAEQHATDEASPAATVPVVLSAVG